jgi:hypothetical protein
MGEMKATIYVDCLVDSVKISYAEVRDSHSNCGSVVLRQ